MKRKVCKKCKLFVKESVCPICQSSDLSENWQGRVYILDADKSEVAKKAEIKNKGEYAIKAR
ncbi:MAG: DNA-directed RNA polymerase subunit E'' [Nanoarchaeota archaeon]|nr:DNA-directed RNA polymerase subunit E'' [Nanoarchaeota archaeon]|tara:strand:- start:1506 stop:1691 length:186 start_codon:yes stop_codon:yes gene_type:complete